MTITYRSVRTALFGLACLAAINWICQAEEKSGGQTSATAQALVLPEFAKHLDAAAAAAALRADDSATLTQLANSLATAEKGAGKVNTPLPAEALYRMAIQVSANNRNASQLDKVESAIKASEMLPEAQKKTMLAEIKLAYQLIGSSARRIDPKTGLKPGEASPESIALHKTFVKEVQFTQQYGTEEELNQLVQAISQLSELHPKQIAHLQQVASTARVAIRERSGSKEPVNFLASASRSQNSGHRIIGPEVVSPNGAFSIVIIPVGKGGETPKTLHLKASNGLTIPATVEWTGKPLVIPVVAKLKPGTVITIAGGPDPAAIAMSLNIQVESEGNKVGD